MTFVHRRLWPALFSAGSERVDWQMRALSPVARRLMALVEESGTAPASASEGRRQLEEAAAAIGAPAKSLPWNRKGGTLGT